MEQKKDLCAQIPLSLHAQVCEVRETAGQTTSEYITNLLIEYCNLKKNRDTMTMSGNTRRMTFQIPEDLFQRIKAHLERETQRTGRKLIQREFGLGLIKEAGQDNAPGTATPPARTLIPRRPRRSLEPPRLHRVPSLWGRGLLYSTRPYGGRQLQPQTFRCTSNVPHWSKMEKIIRCS